VSGAGRRRWPAAVGIAVALALVAGLVTVAVRSIDDGFPHPDEWDPRVRDLAAFVEESRDLEFDHPVYVDFLSAAEYTEQTTTTEEELADEDRDELEHLAGVLRALAVGSGEIDLFAAFNQVSDSGTLAFYDPADHRVRVRGTDLSIGLRVTLVHELTHALQDQHFDLDPIDDVDLDSSASTAFRGLVEGDAMRVEDAYVAEELSAEEQAAYDEEYAGELEESELATADVPPFIAAGFAVPYLLGQPMVLMLANDGGNRAVDDAFDDPPDTEEHLFDPASYLAGEDGEDLDLDLPDDVEVREDGPFGAPSWYLVLAEQLDPKVAFDAALGWAGDAYATFERDGDACVRAVFAGDEASDEEAMAAALDEWAAALPDGMVERVEVDRHPGFESCDPGTDVDLPLTGRSADALFLPSLWGFLVADATTVLDEDGSRCYAAAVIDALTYEQITDPSGAAFEGDAFQQVLTRAFEGCT